MGDTFKKRHMMFKGKKAAVAAGAMPGAIPGERKPNIIEQIFALPIELVKGLSSNLGSLLRYTLIVLLIACAIYLTTPVFRNIGPVAVTQTISAMGFALTDGISMFFANINCAMGGVCPILVDPVDTTQYGVFIDEVYTLKNKFMQWDDIVVKGAAHGELLTSMNTGGCAKLECSLEDGTLKSKSADCIPMKSLSSNVRITCTFNPLVSEDSNLKKASVGLIYDFQAQTDLPISIVDSAEYDRHLNMYLEESDSYREAESKLASFYEVEMEPDATPKYTPIIIGAKIDRSQPVPKGDGYTTLLVTVQNQGGGTAKINDISIDLPDGIAITQTAELSYGAPSIIETAESTWRSLFNKESIPSLDEELITGDFRAYDFALDTSGFPLEDINDYATTRKIRIFVDYTYNTTSSKLVTVTTCDEIGGCEVVAEEETTGVALEETEGPEVI